MLLAREGHEVAELADVHGRPRLRGVAERLTFRIR
jgi:hypothetical protein